MGRDCWGFHPFNLNRMELGSSGNFTFFLFASLTVLFQRSQISTYDIKVVIDFFSPQFVPTNIQHTCFQTKVFNGFTKHLCLFEEAYSQQLFSYLIGTWVNVIRWNEMVCVLSSLWSSCCHSSDGITVLFNQRSSYAYEIIIWLWD